MNRDKMLSKKIVRGPGGRYCSCCGEPPSRAKKERRTAKRKERQEWKKEAGL